MTATTFVDVPEKSWVLILAASKTALISNEGGSTVRMVEAASLPASSSIKGHTINSGSNITRTTGAGLQLYAFGVNTNSHIAVTES